MLIWTKKCLSRLSKLHTVLVQTDNYLQISELNSPQPPICNQNTLSLSPPGPQWNPPARIAPPERCSFSHQTGKAARSSPPLAAFGGRFPGTTAPTRAGPGPALRRSLPEPGRGPLLRVRLLCGRKAGRSGRHRQKKAPCRESARTGLRRGKPTSRLSPRALGRRARWLRSASARGKMGLAGASPYLVSLRRRRLRPLPLVATFVGSRSPDQISVCPTPRRDCLQPPQTISCPSSRFRYTTPMPLPPSPLRRFPSETPAPPPPCYATDPAGPVV